MLLFCVDFKQAMAIADINSNTATGQGAEKPLTTEATRSLERPTQRLYAVDRTIYSNSFFFGINGQLLR
jgi:hypothetical protein